MPDLMDDNQAFLMERLIDDAVISVAKLEQACQLTLQWLGRNLFKVLSKPSDFIYDSACYGRIELFQLPDGRFQKAGSVHV